jgi:hypothetical protein
MLLEKQCQPRTEWPEPPGITTNIEDLAVRGAHDAIFELMVHCILKRQCPCNEKCIESE